MTNRVFPGWWGDADMGEVYTSEYAVNAEDDEGNQYRIYWQFGEIKGEELEDESDYPFDNKHISRVVVQ